MFTCDKDGKECDTAGDVVWRVDGKIIFESSFKNLRTFTPKYRRQVIEETFIKEDKVVSMCSASCSKCKVPAIVKTKWL